MPDIKRRPHDVAREIVTERVEQWQRGVTDGRRSATAVAILARLRRGVGTEPGTIVDILPYTWSEEFVGARDEFEEPTWAERAAHVATCLYALHQQSRPNGMHRRGHGLGGAVRRLVRAEPDSLESDPATRRFVMLGTAVDFQEVTYHARGLVQLLRAEDIPLDYGLLAAHLVLWQGNHRDRVRMAWGRGFHRRQNGTDAQARDPAAVTAETRPGNDDKE